MILRAAPVGRPLASVAAAGSLTLMLITRTAATGHPPYTNMFEDLSAFGAGVVIAAIVFERRSGGGIRVRVYALPLALALFLVAAWRSPRRCG